jgi:hypothetical protein
MTTRPNLAPCKALSFGSVSLSMASELNLYEFVYSRDVAWRTHHAVDALNLILVGAQAPIDLPKRAWELCIELLRDITRLSQCSLQQLSL